MNFFRIAPFCLFVFSLMLGALPAQNCVDCDAFKSVRSRFAFAPKVERFQVTEMVTQMQEVEVPVVKTYETVTRQVYDGGARRLLRNRRVGFMNWGCVATAVGAYFDCSMAKRSQRRERNGILRRLLFFRR